MSISATVLELFWKKQEGADSVPPPGGPVLSAERAGPGVFEHPL